VWSLKATEHETAVVLTWVMERQGRDQSPLGILERVVELDKGGELERARRRSALPHSCSFSANGFWKQSVRISFSAKSEEPLLYV
jgi:hypothetical protein